MNPYKLLKQFFSKLTGNYVTELNYIRSKMLELGIRNPEQFDRLVGRVSYSLKDEEIFQDAVYTLARGKGDCEDYARLFNVMCAVRKMPAYFALIFDDEVGHAFALSYTDKYVYIFDVDMIIRFNRKNLDFSDPEKLIHQTISKYIAMFRYGILSPKGWYPQNIIFSRLNENLMPIESKTHYENPIQVNLNRDEYDLFSINLYKENFIATFSVSAVILKTLSRR